MYQKYRKLILVDLDGVLNTYDGKFDENFIPPVREGAEVFLSQLSQDFDIKLFTTRNNALAKKWVIDNKLNKYIKGVTNIKEPCFLHVDDRCVNFQGDFNKTLAQVQNFSSHWEK